MDVKYYFGRFHLSTPLTNKKEKDDLIISCMKNSIQIPSKEGIFWNIVDFEEIELNNEKFCIGYLVKFKKEIVKEVVNENTNTIDEELLIRAIDKKFPFIFSVKDYIIAYNYIIGYEDFFKTQFCELLRTTSIDIMTTFEITEIIDTADFFNEVKKFDRLTKLEIQVMPSNPKYKELWKSNDERLRKMNVKRLTEKYEGEDIDITEDKNINGSLYMAADGYGTGKVTGKINDNEISIFTGSKQFSKKADRDFLRDATSQLYEWFSELANRYNSGDDGDEK